MLIDYRLAVIHEDGSATAIKWMVAEEDLKDSPGHLLSLLQKEYRTDEVALSAMGSSIPRKKYSDFAELLKEQEQDLIPIVVYRGEGKWQLIRNLREAHGLS